MTYVPSLDITVDVATLMQQLHKEVPRIGNIEIAFYTLYKGVIYARVATERTGQIRHDMLVYMDLIDFLKENGYGKA